MALTKGLDIAIGRARETRQAHTELHAELVAEKELRRKAEKDRDEAQQARGQSLIHMAELEVRVRKDAELQMADLYERNHKLRDQLEDERNLHGLSHELARRVPAWKREFEARLTAKRGEIARLRDENATLRATIEARGIALGPLLGRRVLVVDDEAIVAKVIAATLQTGGAEVRIAGSADEALEVVRSWHPDLVTVDIWMRPKDGEQLLAELRQLPADEGGQVPAIAITGHGNGVNARDLVAAGFAEVLAKPEGLGDLVAVAARVIGGARGGAPDAA